jgi:CheY-like chemotaxis protein
MKTILIVDDEFSVVESLSEILAFEGYRVLTAGNGAQGLAELAKERPDVVLLDMMMPVMNGLEMLKALRESDSWQSLPVVLMTAAPTKVEDGQTPAWSALLRKPFTIASLRTTLAKVLADSEPSGDGGGAQ